MLEKLKAKKEYLIIIIVIVVCIVLGVFYYFAREEITEEGTQTVEYPPRLQELVQKAEAKIDKQSGNPGWTSIFYNDYVTIIYNPQYKDNIKSKPAQAFVVVNKTKAKEATVKGIVSDFFKGLGVQNLSTLKIVWIVQPDLTKK